MDDPISIVVRFFEAWNRGLDGQVRAFESTLADDIRWEQCGLPTVESKDAAVAFVRASATAVGLSGIDVEILKVARDGNTVLTERIDHLRDSEGKRVLSVWLAGILELNPEGKIYAWREYFDPRTIGQMPAIPQP